MADTQHSRWVAWLERLRKRSFPFVKINLIILDAPFFCFNFRRTPSTCKHNERARQTPSIERCHYYYHYFWLFALPFVASTCCPRLLASGARSSRPIRWDDRVSCVKQRKYASVSTQSRRLWAGRFFRKIFQSRNFPTRIFFGQKIFRKIRRKILLVRQYFGYIFGWNVSVTAAAGLSAQRAVRSGRKCLQYRRHTSNV